MEVAGACLLRLMMIRCYGVVAACVILIWYYGINDCNLLSGLLFCLKITFHRMHLFAFVIATGLGVLILVCIHEQDVLI